MRDGESFERLRRCFLVLAALTVGALALPSSCESADSWGGSLGLSSDYLVRGISRTDDRAVLQGEYHYLSTSGFAAGISASSTLNDPGKGADAEINPFVEFSRSISDDWQGKIAVGHYTYPWAVRGLRYDYDELDIDATYQDWLNVVIAYSPNYWRIAAYRRLVSATSTSAEFNLQHSIYHKLVLTGGAGYAHESGPNAAGYVYWSVGAAYDFAPVAFAVAYIGTSDAAKSLFYDEAPGGRWLGTVIWRF